MRKVAPLNRQNIERSSHFDESLQPDLCEGLVSSYQLLEAMPEREGRRRRPMLHVELGENVTHVVDDRTLTDHEGFGDLAVR